MGEDYFWFEWKESPDSRVHLVSAHGELDMVHAHRFRDALIDMAGSTVVVDVSGVTFMDASGVAALRGAWKEIAARGHDLEVRGAHGRVRRVMELCDALFLLRE